MNSQIFFVSARHLGDEQLFTLMKAPKCSDFQSPREEYIQVSRTGRGTTTEKGVLFRAEAKEKKVEDRGISESKVESERLERRRRVGCRINELVDVESGRCEAREKNGGCGRRSRRRIMPPVVSEPFRERK